MALSLKQKHFLRFMLLLYLNPHHKITNAQEKVIYQAYEWVLYWLPILREEHSHFYQFVHKMDNKLYQ